jgi:hypothetical protein
MTDAACTSWPDAGWVADGRPDPDLADVCRHACPVRQVCARYALELDARSSKTERVVGLWGGVVIGHRQPERREALAQLAAIAEDEADVA